VSVGEEEGQIVPDREGPIAIAVVDGGAGQICTPDPYPVEEWPVLGEGETHTLD
jgi:hypothetical protein